METPSHLTLIQASRMLGRAKSTVHGWMKPGGPLESISYHGVRMVDVKRVMAQLEKMRPVEAPKSTEPATDDTAEAGWDDEA